MLLGDRKAAVAEKRDYRLLASVKRARFKRLRAKKKSRTLGSWINLDGKNVHRPPNSQWQNKPSERARFSFIDESGKRKWRYWLMSRYSTRIECWNELVRFQEQQSKKRDAAEAARRS